jgi:hypothetical protein
VSKLLAVSLFLMFLDIDVLLWLGGCVFTGVHVSTSVTDVGMLPVCIFFVTDGHASTSVTGVRMCICVELFLAVVFGFEELVTFWWVSALKVTILLDCVVLLSTLGLALIGDSLVSIWGRFVGWKVIVFLGIVLLLDSVFLLMLERDRVGVAVFTLLLATEFRASKLLVISLFLTHLDKGVLLWFGGCMVPDVHVSTSVTGLGMSISWMEVFLTIVFEVMSLLTCVRLMMLMSTMGLMLFGDSLVDSSSTWRGFVDWEVITFLGIVLPLDSVFVLMLGRRGRVKVAVFFGIVSSIETSW